MIITFLLGHGKGGMWMAGLPGRGEERHSPWARERLQNFTHHGKGDAQLLPNIAQGCPPPTKPCGAGHQPALCLCRRGRARGTASLCRRKGQNSPGRALGWQPSPKPHRSHRSRALTSGMLCGMLSESQGHNPGPGAAAQTPRGHSDSPQKLRTRMGEHTNPSWLRGENHSQTSST